MKKLFCRIIFAFLFLFLVSEFVQAQEQFFVDATVEYKINDDGATTVTQNVSIENATGEVFAKSYALTLENIDPVNPRAFEGEKSLAVFKQNEGSTSTLRVEFDDPVVGKGNKKNFSIQFNENGFVARTGEVWEIVIPRLSNLETFRNYEVVLTVPKSFGEEAYLTPQAKNKEVLPNSVKYFFDKSKVATVGISAGFGEFQIFSFNLKYHLENPITTRAQVEITLPPDTSFQRVYYERLEPEPTNIVSDPDGNWLATYTLDSRARVDVNVFGAVQIFSTPRRGIPRPSGDVLAKNLEASDYWQTDDPAIINLANSLKTPRAIYDYVVSTLSYDYDRVRPNVNRLGAIQALKNPKSAICMEFTDTFIAIARAAGIPAREINGYAYTENPKIEPLSLVADVLHAWPEYWDEKRGVWVPVDPTWANTTGGVDFFNQLDLRHFAFVIHGVDAEKPYPAGSYKLGTNPEKDVFVNFGQLPKVRTSTPQILAEVKNMIPLIPGKVLITVKNPGPTAIYDENIAVFFDSKKVVQEGIKSLMPFSTHTLEIGIPFSPLALKTPETVKVLFADSSLDIPTAKTRAIVANLIAIVLIMILAVIVALMRLKKLKLPLDAFRIGYFSKSKKS